MRQRFLPDRDSSIVRQLRSARGGSASDSGDKMIRLQGYINGLDAEKAKRYRLHSAHRSDARAQAARYDGATGTFSILARTAVVFVE
jgi:hypothetical protein